MATMAAHDDQVATLFTGQAVYFLAGLAVGALSGLEEIARAWQSDLVFTPSMQAEERTRCLHGWRRALERAKGWIEA